MTDIMRVLPASVRGEEVSSANDATLLKDVLERNGELHLFKKIKDLSDLAEDDPPMIFGWQNVEVFVQTIHAAQAQAAAPGGVPLPPDPFALPAAVNVQNFKEAVVEYGRIPGAPARMDTSCLPCSQAECIDVGFKLRTLDFEPWIQRIIAVGAPNLLPIAHIFVPRPRSIFVVRVLSQYPNSLFG